MSVEGNVGRGNVGRAEHVRKAYDELTDALLGEVEESEEHVQKNVVEFLKYFKKAWTGYTYRRREKEPRYAIDIWNVYDAIVKNEPRTNNQSEIWHGQLKEAVRINHSPFYVIAKELQKQHANNNVLRNQFITDVVFKKKKVQADKDERISNVVRTFNIETVLGFLRHVSIAATAE
uniref:Uncharacterized protein n=1 Tax=Panagrolaimus superbus TaxID=310955 RepID=A0A914Z961_9BILA